MPSIAASFAKTFTPAIEIPPFDQGLPASLVSPIAAQRYTVNDIRYEFFLPSQNPTTDEPVQVNEVETDGRAYRLLAK